LGSLVLAHPDHSADHHYNNFVESSLLGLKPAAGSGCQTASLALWKSAVETETTRIVSQAEEELPLIFNSGAVPRLSLSLFSHYLACPVVRSYVRASLDAESSMHQYREKYLAEYVHRTAQQLSPDLPC